MTPASLVTARAAMASRALKGRRSTVRDAMSAYLQAPLKVHNKDGANKPTQWLRLPKAWWPNLLSEADGMTAKFYDPVVRFNKAIYGHPESEAIWDDFLGAGLNKLGWIQITNQPGTWRHAATSSTLVVY
eukprot:16441962-Heterocapsa_arctica.AAC.1